MKPLIHTCLALAVRMALGWFLSGIPAAAQDLNPSQVFEKVKSSVVVVKSQDATGKALVQGSGVRMPSGRVVTNFHVVWKGAMILVGQGNRFLPATIYAADAETDLCLLDAPGLKASYVTLGETSSLKVGALVYAVGSPQGLELSLSNGLVAQLHGAKPPIIQTTAAISPGSSGGGLFDTEGRLVGITSFYMEGGQSLNFALPVEWVAQLKPGLANAVITRPAGDWIARASKLEKEENWPELLSLAQRWIEADPGNGTAWFGLGVAFGGLGKQEKAIEAYRQTLKINPESTSAWYNLGSTYIGLLRFNDATVAYRQALKIDPNDADGWYRLGNTFRRLQRPNDAIDAYRQALKIIPNFAEAWYHMGNALRELQRPGDAIEIYLQALKIKPDHDEAWDSLGNALSDLMRFSDATQAYREALKINPNRAVVWYNLGGAYLNLHRPSDAIEAYREALKIDSNDPGTWNNLVLAYHLSGNNGAALQAVQQLRRLDPAKADKLFDLIVPK